MMNALEEAQSQGTQSNVKPTFGYYRQPDGWITVSPATELDELHYRRRGWEPLTRYGRFEMNSEYTADHPLETLFMLGGVHELSREQIIKSALHLNPPLIPNCRTPLNQRHPQHNVRCMAGARAVVFPQLNDEVLESFQCRFCERPPFSTVQARDQHESVMHKDERGEIRSGSVIADALIKGFGGQAPNAQSVDPLAVLANVGLNKTQRAALLAAGFTVPTEEPEA